MALEVASGADAVADAGAASSAGCSSSVGGFVPVEEATMAGAVTEEVAGLFSCFSLALCCLWFFFLSCF